jgi:hypothetical protein
LTTRPNDPILIENNKDDGSNEDSPLWKNSNDKLQRTVYF